MATLVRMLCHQQELRLLGRWREAGTRLFFAHFFVLLVGLVSVAQWVAFAWLLGMAGTSLPVAAHVVAPMAVYVANRRMIRTIRRQRDGRGWRNKLLRGYSAVAFTSLFCALFLGFTTLLWGTLRWVLGTLTAEAAGLAPAAASSSLDGLYSSVSNVGFTAIAIAFAYGYTFGQRRLTVTHSRIRLRYPPALDGVRIAQISDIHIGQNLTTEQLRRFVLRVNELEPDLICVTGDVADGPAADLDSYLPLLAELRARHGVFVILGNHDHFAGADVVEAALLKHTDFNVLRDAIGVVEFRGTRLHIVGLDDVGRDWARGVYTHPGLCRLQSQLPSHEPVLLLTHRPEPFVQAAALGIGLTLAGHTHGGQIAVPWLDGRCRGLARFVTPFDRGLFEDRRCYLYVNRGVGVTGQRIRLFAPREITVIEVGLAGPLQCRSVGEPRRRFGAYRATAPVLKPAPIWRRSSVSADQLRG